MVKRAIFYGRKDMPLTIDGAKLGILIWFKNGQIWFPILVVEILFLLSCFRSIISTT